MEASRSRCTSVSMPSATTSRLRVRAIWTMTSASASRWSESAMPSTKDLSIFTTSLGRGRGWVREADPWVGVGDALEEGLVHLHHVERQVTEVAQRAVAGAEVVDRQPYADRLQLGQVGVQPLVPAAARGLRAL